MLKSICLAKLCKFCGTPILGQVPYDWFYHLSLECVKITFEGCILISLHYLLHVRGVVNIYLKIKTSWKSRSVLDNIPPRQGLVPLVGTCELQLVMQLSRNRLKPFVLLMSLVIVPSLPLHIRHLRRNKNQELETPSHPMASGYTRIRTIFTCV